MKVYKADFVLLFITFLWGGTFSTMKDIITDVEPFTFVVIRFVLAILFFLIIFNKKIKINKITLIYGLILGFFYTVGFQLQVVGLKYTTASKSAFITGLAVVFTPIFQMAVERKMLNLWQLAGVILSGIGLYIITDPNAGSINYGDMLTIFSSASFAIYIVFIGRFALKADVHGLVIIQFVTMLLLTLPFALMYGHMNFEINTKFVLIMLYVSLLATVLCTYLQTRYQRETTPTRAAIIFTFEPIFAVLIASLFYGEVITKTLITGGVLIIFGLLFSELSDFIMKTYFRRGENEE
jgi:drug/metabolite transporter (DMT)-like permease